jgi:hypothetical protein
LSGSKASRDHNTGRQSQQTQTQFQHDQTTPNNPRDKNDRAGLHMDAASPIQPSINPLSVVFAAK